MKKKSQRDSLREWMKRQDDRFLTRQLQSAWIGLLMLAVYWLVALTDPRTGEIVPFAWNEATSFAAAASVGVGLFFYMSLCMYLRADPFSPVERVFDWLEEIGIIVEAILLLMGEGIVRLAQTQGPPEVKWRVIDPVKLLESGEEKT
jgi:hypothetical protein